jgi:hypothetical protein
MSEDGQDRTKYRIEIENAYGLAIGDSAQTVMPPQSPASREELLSAMHQASAELCAYPSGIAGIHLARSETAQIVEWAWDTDPKERLGMLLDQPGGGKTVVMHDVLEQLEAAQVATLAIKADTLSKIGTHAHAVKRSCVRTTAATRSTIAVAYTRSRSEWLTTAKPAMPDEWCVTVGPAWKVRRTGP